MADRNNIAQHYGYPAKRQMVYWREVEGVPQGKVIERAAKAWPDLPAIHGTTWIAWSQSADYAGIRDRLLAKIEVDADLDADWSAIQQGGMDDTLAALVFQAARQARETGQAPEIGDLRKLVSAAAELGKLNLARAAADWDAHRDAIETEHAQSLATLQAQLAQRDATIAALREQLSGIASGKGLTPETIEEIEHRLRLL